MDFLNFSNRQMVRLSWGYQKLLAPIGIINTLSYIITALAVSKLVAFTWYILFLMLGSSMLFLILLVYLLVKTGTLQNENRQVFNERMSDLWQQQVTYGSLLTAYLLAEEEKKKEILPIKKKIEKSLQLNDILFEE